MLPFGLAVVLLASAGAAADQPAGLLNARIETRSAAAGLEKEVRALLGARSEPFWIGYEVPSQNEGSMCCWSSSCGDGDQGCGGCRLEPTATTSFPVGARRPIALEGGRQVRILLRAEAGRVRRLRMFSEGCMLDAGDRPFVWIDGVRPAESVAWLSTLIDEPLEGHKPEKAHKGEGSGEPVLAAVAMHADPGADAALERWVAADQPPGRRRQAAFWLGNQRRARGRDVLVRLLKTDPDPKLREHVIFALTQNKEPGAIEAVIEAAHEDRSAHVRGQALFWLAQAASKRAPAAIRDALDNDPEVEVKKKAVFALSQLPKDEGVPLLIGLARTHRSPEVRKQAMFWLGQSGDPRALSFFEEVLNR